jgi:hypothetical protein
VRLSTVYIFILLSKRVSLRWNDDSLEFKQGDEDEKGTDEISLLSTT